MTSRCCWLIQPASATSRNRNGYGSGTIALGRPTMTPFSQSAWAFRCEWGPGAVSALAPADVAIVVDVFSFTTCVDVATSRGAAILPYPWKDALAADFALAQGAELAGRRRQSQYSLAPESYLEAPKGLRCVLPSPNGAQVTLAAAPMAPVVLAGSLRN